MENNAPFYKTKARDIDIPQDDKYMTLAKQQTPYLTSANITIHYEEARFLFLSSIYAP